MNGPPIQKRGPKSSLPAENRAGGGRDQQRLRCWGPEGVRSKNEVRAQGGAPSAPLRCRHYDLDEIWADIRDRADAKAIKSTLIELARGESTAWDLDDARRELLDRGFSQDEFEGRIPLCLREWANSLE
jgi:hypothetical protein